MYFLAIGRISHPEGLAALQEAEDATLQQLRREGTVVRAFRYAEGHGVVGIFQGPDVHAVAERMGTLPFVANDHLHFDYSEIVEL